MCWILDFGGYSLKNAPPLKVSIHCNHVLQTHFPERLGLAICYHAPTLFSLTWKVRVGTGVGRCGWLGMGVHTYHAPDRVQREKILWPRLGHVQGVKVKPGGGRRGERLNTPAAAMLLFRQTN